MMSSKCTATMSHQGNLDAPFSLLLGIAEDELHGLRRSLPPPLRVKLDRVAVLLEDLPSPEFLSDGVEPDQLGLFEGAPASDGDSSQPPRITLWLGNHWDFCEAQEAAYRAEVRTTFLHELGHFLGLDELDIEERGLG